MAEEPAPAPQDGEKPEAKKARGRPKDPNAPIKPKNPMQRVHAEARERIKAEKPELAVDLRGMALALKEAWDSTPEAVKERLAREYEEEMKIWKPKWEAYIQTPGYKDFFELKQDYIDMKTKKIMIKKHTRGKIEVGKVLRVGGKFVHEFGENSPDNYELKPGQRGTVVAVMIDEEKSAKVNWDGLGERVFLKKYHGKVEDPEVPKRPKSGYMIFAGEVREECQKEVFQSGGGLSDVGKKVAEKWAALSEAQKARFDELAAKQKEVFDKEFAEYRQTEKFKDFENRKVNLLSKQQLKKLERTKLRDAPKTAPSGFALYRKKASSELMEQDKAEGKPFDRAAFAKRLKEMWDALPESEKAAYLEKSEQLKKEFDSKKNDFKTTRHYIGFLEQRQKLKARQNRLVNLRDMPKKPKSVFAMFAAEHKKEVPQGKGDGKGTSALKAKFAEAPEDEKKRLEEKQKEMLEKWQQDVNSFKEGEQYKKFEVTDKKVKQEFMNEALKVMTLKFLNAAPPQPPKSAFAIYVADKRKAQGEADEVPKDKKQRAEDLAKFKVEWKKLDRSIQGEYDQKMKDRTAAWKEEVKAFCEEALWKEYLAEAKRLRVPIKTLLTNKNKAISRLKNGMRWTPMPDKPDDMPSKPPSAKRLFFREKKPEEPDIEKLAQMWEELDAEGKKRYEDQADAATKQYNEDMRAFRQSDEGKHYLRSLSNVRRNRVVTRAKFQYLKEMPKKPPTALRMFMDKHAKEEKKANPEAKGHDIGQKLRERWLSMSAEEKAPLEQAASQKLEEYEAAMKAFKEGENWQKYNKAIKPNFGKAKAKTKAKVMPAPRKPEGYPEKPGSAFKDFCKTFHGQGKDVAALQKAWQALPADEKAAFDAKAKENEEAWTKAMEEFNKTAAGKKYKRELQAFDRRKKISAAKAKYLKKAPKKFQNAFAIFSAEKREEVQNANPGLKGLVAMQAKLGELWKALSDDEKKPYMDKEAESRAGYEKAKAEFESSADYKRFKAAEANASGKGRAKAKATSAPEAPPGLPKKPIAAPMMLFKVETRAGKDSSQKWMELGAAGQAEYVKKVKDMQAEYEAQMKAFKATDEGKKYLKALNAYEKKKKESATRDRIMQQNKDMPAEPKRPQTAYFMFVGENRKNVSGSMGEVGKKLSEMWNSLEKAEKEQWEEKAKEAKEVYEKAMAEYKNHPSVKKLDRALSQLKGKKPVKAKKAAKPAKAKKAAKAKAKAASGRGRGAPKAAAKSTKSDSDTDSDAMGSDSSSSSSDSDSD